MQDESGNRLKGLVFRAADKAFCALLEDRSMKPLHIAGHLKCDIWQGQQNLNFLFAMRHLSGLDPQARLRYSPSRLKSRSSRA